MTKYTKHGHECNVIQKLEDGRLLISPIREVEVFNEEIGKHEWHLIEGELEIVDQVYSLPPKKKLHDEIKKLDQQILEIKKNRAIETGKLSDAKIELSRIKAEIKDLNHGWININFKKKEGELVVFSEGGFVPKFVDKTKIEYLQVESYIKPGEKDFQTHYSLKSDYSTRLCKNWGLQYDVPAGDILKEAHERFIAKADYFLKAYTGQSLVASIKWIPEVYHDRVNAKDRLRKDQQIKDLESKIESLKK